MSNQTLDALVYASIKNNLSVDEIKKIQGNFDKPTSLSSMTDAEYRDFLLNNTTIKRACSMYYGKSGIPQDKFTVNVRIPTPAGYVYDESSTRTPTQKKFGYIDKAIDVPASLCETLDPIHKFQNTNADNFMALYCRNAYSFYLSESAEIGSTPTDDEFASFYKPECACYINKPPYISGDGIPASCFAPGCSLNDAAYLDPNSRQPCTLTICQSNFNISDVAAGGQVSINTKIAQQCGGEISKAGVVNTSAESQTQSNTNLSSGTGATPINQTTPTTTTPSTTIVQETKNTSQETTQEIIKEATSSTITPTTSTTTDKTQAITKVQESTNVTTPTTTTETQPTTETQSTTSTASNTMLYVGIGICVCVIILIIIAYFMFGKRSATIDPVNSTNLANSEGLTEVGEQTGGLLNQKVGLNLLKISKMLL